MKNPKYGYDWERTIINFPRTSRSETRAWWDGDTAKAATYKRDEFQVATAEKVGN